VTPTLTTDVPEAACPRDAKPLVFAYEQANGALRLARCTSDEVLPEIIGATPQLV
jgi:hypothetical protein